MPSPRIARAWRRLAWIGVPLVLLVLAVAFFNWDWLIPMVEARAAAATGRQVTIAHLHVRLRPVVTVTAEDVVVANPPDWPAADAPLARIHALTVEVDVWRYLYGGGLVLPLIGIDAPRILAAETKDGAANFRLAGGGGSAGKSTMRIGDVRITDGVAHVVMPKLKTDFTAKIATEGEGDAAKIVVDAKGTYAAQPITARLVGGALLSLRDTKHPWPVDLNLANGPTRVALDGTIQDPLAFQGADLRLRFSGPDLGLLEPLAGFPIPTTPPYQVSGRVGLQGFEKIRFEDVRGRMGRSDLAGTIEEQPGSILGTGKSKPVVTMELRSNRVDLADLAGVIGAPAGGSNPIATPQQKEALARAKASPKLLPDTPISVPKLKWADVHLRYHGAHIEGRNMPLDDLDVVADMVNGRITVHPVSFGVGKGRLSGNAELTPINGKEIHARMDLHLQNLDVSRMMAATHTFQGAGSVSGVGAIDATGDSVASMAANGNGGLKMAMAGGDLSAMLVDLTGLQFGNALLSALGMPQKTPVQCFVADLAMQRGVLRFQAMTLDTGEAITNVGGSVDLGKETIDLNLKTDAKHFSIGSLPTRINISGTFKDPKIRPGAEVAARAGAAAGLAALFAPLAILPTVQFGTSEAEDARCGELLQQARASAGGKALPPPKKDASSGH